MKIKAGILVDLGNSETRMILLSNNSSKLTVLNNRYAALPSNYLIPKEYNNSKSSVLCVNGAFYAEGALAEREFSDKLIRPSSVQPKTEQLVTEISLNLVIINALQQLAESRGLGVSDLDVCFNVSVLLPPMEHDMKTTEMINMLKKITSVTSLLPFNFTNKVSFDTVQVLPEGVAAFFGVYYEEVNDELVERPENKEFATGNVLIVDIGAGTTDVVLIQDTELVLNSKETYNKGGNTVESNLRNEIRRAYGFQPTNMDEIVQTCQLLDGAKVIDVAELVTEAKRGYSKVLIPELTSYLERLSISPREVKGILVVGGGSLPSIRDGVVVSPAMSEVLIGYFKTLAPNATLLNIGDNNPRLLNIQGLQYIHKYA